MLSPHLHDPEPFRRRFPASLLFVCLGLAVGAVGCAASGALHRGQTAELRQDNDLAVVEYTKALRLRPDDTNARLSLDRAKLRASQDHFTRARRFAAASKYDQ